MPTETKTFTYQELAELGATPAVRSSGAAEYVKLCEISANKGAANANLKTAWVMREGVLTRCGWTEMTAAERQTTIDVVVAVRYLGDEAIRVAQAARPSKIVSVVRPVAYASKTPSRYPNSSWALNKPMASSEDTYEKAAKYWEIPRTMNVASHAAMFYLLYARSQRGDPRAAEELDFFIASMEPHILSYLDMATGGEARYMSSMAVGYNKGTAPEEVEKEVMASKYIKWEGGLAKLYRKNGRAINLSRDGGRPDAWMAWKDIREELGVDALNWCIIAHLESPSGSYGGPLWANAAYLIRRRELGEISGTFLIDQAFSLQHNGGEIFNKMWDVSSLVTVLNLAFQGKTQSLHKYLKLPEHQALYRRVCVEATPFDLRQQQGQLELRVKKMATFKTSTVLGLKAGV